MVVPIRCTIMHSLFAQWCVYNAIWHTFIIWPIRIIIIIIIILIIIIIIIHKYIIMRMETHQACIHSASPSTNCECPTTYEGVRPCNAGPCCARYHHKWSQSTPRARFPSFPCTPSRYRRRCSVTNTHTIENHSVLGRKRIARVHVLRS